MSARPAYGTGGACVSGAFRVADVLDSPSGHLLPESETGSSAGSISSATFLRRALRSRILASSYARPA